MNGMSSMPFDPKMAFQTAIFEVAMESVLKMSNLIDLKVFILFEDVEKRRHFGGHEDLCDLYNDGILEAQKGDVELAAGKTDLRVVHKSEGVRGRLYDHRPPAPELDGPSVSSSNISTSSNLTVIQPSTQQPQNQFLDSTKSNQKFLYEQLYKQLQSVLLQQVKREPQSLNSEAQQQQQHPVPQGQIFEKNSRQPHLVDDNEGTSSTAAAAAASVSQPLELATSSPTKTSAPSVHSMATRFPRVAALDNDSFAMSPESPLNEAHYSPIENPEPAVKMSKRNILKADLEERLNLEENDASDCGSDGASSERKRGAATLDEALDAKIPKIDEIYVTDPVLEQKIKKIEEDIGFDIAREYHDKTKHLLSNVRQPRQPSSPLTSANFDGRMRQIVVKHHASQIIVHPPVGAQRHNPNFQQPQIIYQQQAVPQIRTLVPNPPYPGPGTTLVSSDGVLSLCPSTESQQTTSGTEKTAISAPTPVDKPRIIVTAASAVERSVAAKNKEIASIVTPPLSVFPGRTIAANPSGSITRVPDVGHYIIVTPSTPMASAVFTSSSPGTAKLSTIGAGSSTIPSSINIPVSNVGTVSSAVPSTISTLDNSSSVSLTTIDDLAKGVLTGVQGNVFKKDLIKKVDDLDGIPSSGISCASSSVVSRNLNLESSMSKSPISSASTTLPSISGKPLGAVIVPSSKDPPSTRACSTGKEEPNQAELMIKLYQTLAEVVFGPQGADRPESSAVTSQTRQDQPNGVVLSDSKEEEDVAVSKDPTPEHVPPIVCQPSRQVFSLTALEESTAETANEAGSPLSTISEATVQSSSTGLGEGENVCHICQYRFKRISHLRQHVQEVHEKERRFSCEICRRLFKRAEHLRKHMRTVHKGAKPDEESECIVLT